MLLVWYRNQPYALAALINSQVGVGFPGNFTKNCLVT